jgi:hypothetical protein
MTCKGKVQNGVVVYPRAPKWAAAETAEGQTTLSAEPQPALILLKIVWHILARADIYQ